MLHAWTRSIFSLIFKSEINIVDRRVCKLKFLLGDALQRGINELLAGVVSLDIAHFGAVYLIAFACRAKLAVFAGGLDIVAEQLFLCHMNSSSLNKDKYLCNHYITVRLKCLPQNAKIFPRCFCLICTKTGSKNRGVPLSRQCFGQSDGNFCRVRIATAVQAQRISAG